MEKVNKQATKKNTEKNKSLWPRILSIGILLFVVFGIIYYMIGSRNLWVLDYNEFSGLNPSQVATDLDEGVIVEQKYLAHADYITGITLRFGTYSSKLEDGTIHVEYLERDTLLASSEIDATDIEDNVEYLVDFGKTINIKRGTEYTIRLYEDGANGTRTPAVWAGVNQDGCTLTINGEPVAGVTIYFEPQEQRFGYFNEWFFSVYFGLLGLFIATCIVSMHKDKQGKKTPLTEIVHIFDTYKFLLHQLIDKEFAIKYRRSYLGIVWVVLSPLLTMILMSFVFSTIFKQSIPKFQVYLIIGNVAFSYFVDSTTGALPTIVSSSSMLKKIYVPKYIFPLSKVIFSFVNFMISFIPVAGVMIFYRVMPTVNLLYLPVILAAFFMFTLGIGFILSTMMVMMRDTQYLYNLVTTLLCYITPIFYSLDNFTPRAKFIMNLNPLTRYLTIIREVAFYGTTPTVQELLIVILIGIVFLWIGLEYFFKKQDKFILYI